MSVPRTTPVAFFWVTESRPSLEKRKTQSAAATYVRPAIEGSPDTSRAIETPSPSIIGYQSCASSWLAQIPERPATHTLGSRQSAPPGVPVPVTIEEATYPPPARTIVPIPPSHHVGPPGPPIVRWISDGSPVTDPHVAPSSMLRTIALPPPP